MQEIFVKHNPYTIETYITINDEILCQNSGIGEFLHERFQMWVDKLPHLLSEETNDRKFHLKFNGTYTDYQDLLAAINDSVNEGLIFENTEFIPGKEFGDKENELKILFNKVQSLPFEELQSSSLRDAFDKASSSTLDVNVVATMSAGKSTLINSLLGRKLMPSKEGACTAIITKIQDDDDDNFKAVVYDTSDNEVQKFSSINYAQMKDLNKDPSVSLVDVKGNIPFVSAEGTSLVLIDTPGPDNARDKNHFKVTEKALDSSSKMLVLFVMNGGTLHNEGQDLYLRRIARSMSANGKQSKERFIFVINKMDDYDDEDDDIQNETIPDTVKYLEEMGIKNPNIFPVSAKVALGVRQYLKGEISIEKIESDAKKLVREKQLHLEKYSNLPKVSRQKIEGELQQAEDNNDIFGQALIHSGIRNIEEMICLYVEKYCLPQKIKTLVESFRYELDSATAFEVTRNELVSNQEKFDEIKKQIEALEEKLQSKAENDAFKKRIDNYKLPSDLPKQIDDLIANIEGEFTEFFTNCPEEMEDYEAETHMKRFSKTASTVEAEFECSVNRILNEDIREKSQLILDEYISHLNTLSEEFSGNGLKINLTNYVQNKLRLDDTEEVINLSSDQRIESHIEKRNKTRQVTKKRKVTGWDRVLHISKWFDPWETYTTSENYTVDVKVDTTVVFISREKLQNNLISRIRKNLQDSKQHVLEFANEETENIKEYFYEQFDEVDHILLEKANELKECTVSKEKAAEILKKSQDLMNDLDETKSKLESILEI